MFDSYYAQLLHRGFLVLRQAIDSGSKEWIHAEMEHLHNIPSLIGEANINRHRYYWDQERRAYTGWIQEHGSDEAHSRMRTYYEPIWEEMIEPMEQCLGHNLDVSLQ